jgi:O-succinylbenzoate synthase
MGEDGVLGLGEASPLPGFSSENLADSARQSISLAASLIGRDLTRDWLSPDGAFSRELDEIGLSPSARFGVELAVWNLYAASEGKSFLEILCSSPVSTVPVNGLLSGPVEDVLAEGRRMREAGYEAVKLKVGGRGVEEDAELVRELRKVLGEGVALRLDANRAWSFAEAESFARVVEGTEYEYVEEPLADPLGLEGLVREYGVAVALDESLVGMSPEDLRCYDYVRAVVIKPTLVGGISQTLRLAEEARRLGITLVISSAYETGVGTEALLALSAATGDGRIAAGLDTYRRLGADVLYPPLDMSVPRIDVREIVGLRRRLQQGYLSVVRSTES